MRTIAAFLAAMLAVPVTAQGPISTIERGAYVCELPGDASGAAGVEQPQQGFVIRSSSRYETPQGIGTYLRRGDRLTMTSGPRSGEAYQVVSRKYLRKLEADGSPGRLRCLLRSR